MRCEDIANKDSQLCDSFQVHLPVAFEEGPVSDTPVGSGSQHSLGWVWVGNLAPSGLLAPSLPFLVFSFKPHRSGCSACVLPPIPQQKALSN